MYKKVDLVYTVTYATCSPSLCTKSTSLVYTYVYVSYKLMSRSIVDIKNKGPRAIAQGTQFYISTVDYQPGPFYSWVLISC